MHQPTSAAHAGSDKKDRKKSPIRLRTISRSCIKKFVSNVLSHRMRKQTICLGENSNCEADQRLCFRYTDSTISLLSKSKIFRLYPSSVTVQPGLCWTCSEPKLLIFSRTDSFLQVCHTSGCTGLSNDIAE